MMSVEEFDFDSNLHRAIELKVSLQKSLKGSKLFGCATAPEWKICSSC